MTYEILKQLEIRVAKLEKYSAPRSEEKRFFDNPQAREVREFSDTEAISNDPEVALKSVSMSDAPDRNQTEAIEQAIEAPPTVKDNKNQEGAKNFSTLHRFVVETAEDEPTLPNNFKEAPKAEIIKTKREKKLEKEIAVKLAYLRRNS
jgi:hypothetical protein